MFIVYEAGNALRHKGNKTSNDNRDRESTLLCCLGVSGCHTFQKKKRKIGDDEEDDEDGGNNDDDEEVITEEHLQYVDARNPAAHRRTVTAETYQSSLLWWHKVDNIAEYRLDTGEVDAAFKSNCVLYA